MKASVIVAVLLTACAAAAQNIPDIRPGDTCEKLRARFGTESSAQGPAHIWRQGALTITVLVKPNGPCVAGAVDYSVDAGHVFITRDGILLGKDTLVAASLKLKGRINDNNYISLRGEGKAYGQIEAPPTPSFPFKGTYSWQLNQAAAQKLNAPPKRSDFSDEPVIFYSVDTPDSHD
jgi:hypothetical protein